MLAAGVLLLGRQRDESDASAVRLFDGDRAAMRVPRVQALGVYPFFLLACFGMLVC